MKLEHEIVTVRTRTPFVIARGGSSEWRRVWIRVIDHDGAVGWGEAAPSRFYGESPESVIAALDLLGAVLRANAWSLDAIEREMNTVLRFNASAKSAVSAALHDLAAKRLGVPLYRMLGLDPADAPQSSFTIPITADDDGLRRALDDAAPYPILKVKLGGPRDADTIVGVRASAPDKILRVDANAAWTAKHALHMIDILLDYGVELVEQPVAAHDIEGLRFVRDRSPLPIIADESCLVAADVPRLVGAVDGINLKLAKCGGLREAMRIVAAARAHGMSVMAGCMVETSLGISAAAHLAPLLDHADLDGAALLADDPFRGASIANGVIALRTHRVGRYTSGWGRAAADMLAEVALPLPLFNTFSYRLDNGLANAVVPGARRRAVRNQEIGICVGFAELTDATGPSRSSRCPTPSRRSTRRSSSCVGGWRRTTSRRSASCCAARRRFDRRRRRPSQKTRRIAVITRLSRSCIATGSSHGRSSSGRCSSCWSR
jgi:L-alanine-DL-glutamate epimerase-like enolase superfamily enzyme